MMAIFSDFCEKICEVFMDDFSIYGSSFDDCLSNLDQVLQRCEETNLVLNWEKCHFMVNEGIVLGQVVNFQEELRVVSICRLCIVFCVVYFESSFRYECLLNFRFAVLSI